MTAGEAGASTHAVAPDQPGAALDPDPVSKVGANTALNLAGSVAPVIAAVVTLPIYLDLIGPTRYGVLSIVWVLVGYFGFFGAGLGRSVAHHVARWSARPEGRIDGLFWTAMAVNLLLGAIGGVVLLVLAGILFGRVFDVPAALTAEVMAVVPWLALSVPVVGVGAVLTGALEGQERFGSANALGITSTVLIQVAPVFVALSIGPELPGLVGAVVVVRAALVLLGLAACIRLLPLRGRAHIDRLLVPPLVRFGGWITGSFFVIPFLMTLDQLMIGSLLGLAWVAPYAIAFNLVTQFLLIPTSLSRTLFPRFSRLSPSGIRSVAHAANRAQAAVMAPLVVAAIALIEPVLHVWIGPELGAPAAAVGRILLVGMWLNSLAFIPFAWLQGEGRPAVAAGLHIAQLVPYGAILWLGIHVAGLTGAAWAWGVRAAVDAALLFWAVGVARSYYTVLIVPTILACGVAFASYLVNPLSPVGLALNAGAVLLAVAWAWRSAPDGPRLVLAWLARVLGVGRRSDHPMAGP